MVRKRAVRADCGSALANAQAPDGDKPICDENHAIANVGPSTVGPDTTRSGGLEIGRGQNHANVTSSQDQTIVVV